MQIFDCSMRITGSRAASLCLIRLQPLSTGAGPSDKVKGSYHAVKGEATTGAGTVTTAVTVPKQTASVEKSSSNTGKIIKTLLQYVWPPNNTEVRARVLVSLTLLVGAKAVGICVPFLFKEICDALDATRLVMETAPLAEGVGTAAAKAASVVDPTKLALVTPVAALLGCE
jgi:hypothetical protein